MRRQSWLRAFTIAVLAASLSLVGPGARALASEPGRLAQQARDGQSQSDQQIAHPAPSSPRVALRPRGSSPDDHGGRQLAIALATRARHGAVVFERLVSESAPRLDPQRVPVTVRSSRGPPQG